MGHCRCPWRLIFVPMEAWRLWWGSAVMRGHHRRHPPCSSWRIPTGLPPLPHPLLSHLPRPPCSKVMATPRPPRPRWPLLVVSPKSFTGPSGSPIQRHLSRPPMNRLFLTWRGPSVVSSGHCCLHPQNKQSPWRVNIEPPVGGSGKVGGRARVVCLSCGTPFIFLPSARQRPWRGRLWQWISRG